MIREKIDRFHLEDIKNKKHPSVFYRSEMYDLFILRIPQYEENKSLSFVSKAFVITQNKYYFYEPLEDKFVDLIDVHGFYKHLDKSVDTLIQITLDYLEKLESIEDTFYEGKSVKHFNKKWFEYKNIIVRINRVLGKAEEVLKQLTSYYKKEEDYLERNFEDLQEHLQRGYRNSGFLLEKLDALYNFHQTKTNEQMNKVVYTLTILSAIFLPLNFLVGFFGMNTTSLPFTQSEGGTYNVMLLLLITFISAFVITNFIRKN